MYKLQRLNADQVMLYAPQFQDNFAQQSINKRLYPVLLRCWAGDKSEEKKIARLKFELFFGIFKKQKKTQSNIS